MAATELFREYLKSTALLKTTCLRSTACTSNNYRLAVFTNQWRNPWTRSKCWKYRRRAEAALGSRQFLRTKRFSRPNRQTKLTLAELVVACFQAASSRISVISMQSTWKQRTSRKWTRCHPSSFKSPLHLLKLPRTYISLAMRKTGRRTCKQGI